MTPEKPESFIFASLITVFTKGEGNVEIFFKIYLEYWSEINFLPFRNLHSIKSQKNMLLLL
jgi:hypothetical protein